MKFHTRFFPPKSPGLKCAGGLTDQHFKDECDLNQILRRFRATGVPPPMKAPVYADLTQSPTDVFEAFEKLEVIQDWFFDLPSALREKYENDPLRAWKFIQDNPQEAIKEGLLPSSRSPGDVSPSKAGEAHHSQAAAAATPEPPKEAAKPPPAA